ncbi:hypothetical protein ACHAXR_011871 [Thalassiosira sp. AJA248-18]
MASSPKPSSPKSNYGSISRSISHGDNSSKASCRPPIQLHASLESLDVGPHAFRSHTTCTPPLPQDGQTAHSSPSPQAPLLFSPLLRKFSGVGGDPTLASSHSPSLNTPILDDVEGKIGPPTLESKDIAKQKNESFIYYIVYALVNSIMCVPCLYGYASVIFSHSVFQPHINALSKLVILSSVVHQFCFSIFSSLPFSIGQVQDAGLIFLSAMSHRIATSILTGKGDDDDDDDVVEEVVSTTIVLLGLSTASLGAVLILAGKFRVADAVAYLPLPVVGGYLAFIGYFCLEAGVALCIGTTIMKPTDWAKLFHAQSLLLSFPGILSGLFLTFVARKCSDEAMLPLSMIAIPVIFYLVLFIHGLSIEDAREGGWVGETSPPVPVSDLFQLVDFGKVRWDLVTEIIPTWAGMVFVVSFSSCLDVAAISMDMGEALDVNNELMTVGISNLLAGLAGGFTGSYIFSQTIFTYRTGCRSRWIGILVAFTFIAVVVSTINFLEVTPLFFLGSCLMFIGFDLLYEWIVEVRHKLLFSEYLVLLATFVAIQFLGINGGIGVGIAVAIFDFVVTTASVSSVVRVSRRSLAMWRPQERTFIENHVYNAQCPKIVTLECRGSVFFGSSISMLSNVLDETGLMASVDEKEKAEISRLNSPLPHRPRLSGSLSPASVSPGSGRLERRKKERPKQPERRNLIPTPNTTPRFLVLDLSSVSNVDASAARGCFLQLAKMCAKRKIVVCAAGANSRIDWIMQTHDTAHHVDIDGLASGSIESSEKIILFDALDEALQFCEKSLIDEAPCQSLSFRRLEDLVPVSGDTPGISLSTAFTHFLGLEPNDAAALIDYEKCGKAFHSETLYKSGEVIFASRMNADGFFVVLSGSVVVLVEDRSVSGASNSIFSGAGMQHIKQRRNIVESGQVSRVLSVGSVVGFVDFVLKRPRTFSVIAGKDSLIAQCHRSGLDELKKDNPDLDRIVDKVLLLCSVVELATRDP